MNRIIPIILSLLLTASLRGEVDQKLLPAQQTKLAINNRPLVRVHGKTISLLDVMRQMDIALSDYNPDVLNSESALFQYYSTYWKQTLDELIAEELILSDAEEKEIKISDGDIREELESRFGPNIAATLSKLGLTYDEALDHVKKQMIVDRMKWYKVHSKARQEVTPKAIKEAYQDYLTKNPAKNEWAYKFLTIRGADEETRKAAEELAGNYSLDEIKEKLASSDAKVTVSSEYKAVEANIAKQHRDILTSITDGSFSSLVEQKDRKGTKLLRIFELVSKNTLNPIEFDLAYAKIENELLHQRATAGEKEYVGWLKEKFNLTDDILTGHLDGSYEPFSLH